MRTKMVSNKLFFSNRLFINFIILKKMGLVGVGNWNTTKVKKLVFMRFPKEIKIFY